MTEQAFERTLAAVFAAEPTPAERRVLELWVRDGLRQSEIATRLRLSASTVDSLLASAAHRSHAWASGDAEITRPRRGFERALLMTYAVQLHIEEQHRDR